MIYYLPSSFVNLISGQSMWAKRERQNFRSPLKMQTFGVPARFSGVRNAGSARTPTNGNTGIISTVLSYYVTYYLTDESKSDVYSFPLLWQQWRHVDA